MAYRLGYQVVINWVPDGMAGSAVAYGGGNSCSPSMGTAGIDFFTLPQGVSIPFNGTIGSSPTAADLTTAFNAMVTQLNSQITTPVLNRIQQFANGGS